MWCWKLQKRLCRCLCRCSFVDADTNERFSALWLLLPVKPICTTGFKTWMQLSKRTNHICKSPVQPEAPSKLSVEKKGPAHDCAPRGLGCAKSRLCEFLALHLQLSLLTDTAFLSQISKAEGRRGRQRDYFKLDILAQKMYRIIGKTCNKHIIFSRRFWPKNYWLV